MFQRIQDRDLFEVDEAPQARTKSTKSATNTKTQTKHENEFPREVARRASDDMIYVYIMASPRAVNDGNKKTMGH